MSFAKTSAALAEVISRISEWKKEPSFSCGVVGDDFVLAPGKITVIGAPPGTGKTAIGMQTAFTAIEENDDLRLIIANAEMDISELLLREISRRSGVGHGVIRKAEYDKQQFDDLTAAALAMTKFMPRVRHMTPPFTVEALKPLTADLHPGLIVVDYLQKFRSDNRDARQGVNEMMDVMRELAMNEWSVLAMSATTRQQNGKKGGHDHSSLSLSSFKESGEIEFNADACYVLRNMSDDDRARVKDVDLDCVKNRGGPLHRIELQFCGDFMRFEARAPERHSEFDAYSVVGGGF